MTKTIVMSMLGAALLWGGEYAYEFTPVLGGVIKEGNLNLENEKTIGGEFQFNNLDLGLKPEISVLYSPGVDYEPAGGDTDIYRLMLNGVYDYDLKKSVTPFAKVGVGYEHMGDRLYENDHSCFVDAGGGVKYGLSDTMALKLEAIYMLKRNDNRWDNNLATLVGLTFKFGAHEQKPAPEPAEEAPVTATVVDTDGDGVADADDSCKQTPAGVKVDAKGCALDSDGDGVADHLDSCPMTPKGVKVDSKGCALDSDNDGVADHLDNCPTTPAGAAVNEKGCQLDSDNDGVVDALDKCPNSEPFVAVDRNGCAENIILDINFETASAVIDEAHSPKLKKYIDFMKRNTEYDVTIIGHTDSKGSATFNQKLSEKRAQAVKAALVDGGVEADRVKAVGKGEAEPIADNGTAAGMAKNRRIEAKLSLRQ